MWPVLWNNIYFKIHNMFLCCLIKAKNIRLMGNRDSFWISSRIILTACSNFKPMVQMHPTELTAKVTGTFKNLRTKLQWCKTVKEISMSSNSKPSIRLAIHAVLIADFEWKTTIKDLDKINRDSARWRSGVRHLTASWGREREWLMQSTGTWSTRPQPGWPWTS